MSGNNSKWQIWTKTIGESHTSAKLVGLNLEQLDAVNLTAKLNDMIVVRRMVEWKNKELEKVQARPNRRTRRAQASRLTVTPTDNCDVYSPTGLISPEVYPEKKSLKMPNLEFYYREESFPIFEIWYTGNGKNKKIRTLFDQDIANRTCTTLQKFYARYHKEYTIYMMLVPYKPSTDIIFPGYLTLTDKDISDEKCQQSMLQMFQITESDDSEDSDESDDFDPDHNMLFDALQSAEFDEMREALISELFNFDEFLRQDNTVRAPAAEVIINYIPAPGVDFLLLDFNPEDPMSWNVDESSEKAEPVKQEEYFSDNYDDNSGDDNGDIWSFMNKLTIDIFDYMEANGWFSPL